MSNNPTNEHQEQAHEILRKWVEAHNDGTAALSTTSPEQDDLRDRIAVALSSRDAEVREVLEGLSYFVTFSDGKKVRHWCARHEACSPACKAAAALYAKTSGEKENSENG